MTQIFTGLYRTQENHHLEPVNSANGRHSVQHYFRFLDSVQYNAQCINGHDLPKKLSALNNEVIRSSDERHNKQ
jgi:hypothetical protein